MEALAFVLDNRFVILVVFVAFFVRFFLADWNSYWNDEILSVYVYGVANPTVVDAARLLSEKSVHPPLYQVILYSWMLFFGSSELATRTLSNLYITLSGLLFYFIVKVHWSRRLALFSTVGFSFAFSAVYFGLESRSYSQTIFLVTLSSYLFISTLTKMLQHSAWSIKGNWGSVVALIAVNLLLALTHYYNLFWLLAQSLFGVMFLVCELPKAKRGAGALAFVGVFSAAPVLFGITWGSTLVRQYESKSDSWAVQGTVARSPVELLYSSVFEPNLSGGVFASIAVAACIFAFAVMVMVRMFRNRPKASRQLFWGYIHLVWWLVVPVIIVFLSFTVLGVERYQARYFLFSLPPLFGLFVISVFTFGIMVFRRTSLSNRSAISSAVIAMLMTILILPGSYQAATSTKSDSRGNTKQIVGFVEKAPSEYFLLELSFGGARSNYYLERFSDTLRVDYVVSSGAERRSEFGGLSEVLNSALPEKIVLILNGYHGRQSPDNLLKFLAEEYRIVLNQKLKGQAGFILFERNSSDG
jgi:uncharacterized membrane protein